MHLEAGTVVGLVAAGEIVWAVGWRRSPVQTEGSGLLLRKICGIGEPFMQPPGVDPGRLPPLESDSNDAPERHRRNDDRSPLVARLFFCGAMARLID